MACKLNLVNGVISKTDMTEMNNVGANLVEKQKRKPINCLSCLKIVEKGSNFHKPFIFGSLPFQITLVDL